VTEAHGSPDAVALVWDLTVHRLHQAFAESLAAPPNATQGGQRPPAVSISPAGIGLAGVRLAATRHAVNDIQDALRRMAAGSYGTCEQWPTDHDRTAAGGADHPVVSGLPGRPAACPDAGPTARPLKHVS
jgi:hypothetical protein